MIWENRYIDLEYNTNLILEDIVDNIIISIGVKTSFTYVQRNGSTISIDYTYMFDTKHVEVTKTRKDPYQGKVKF